MQSKSSKIIPKRNLSELVSFPYLSTVFGLGKINLN